MQLLKKPMLLVLVAVLILQTSCNKEDRPTHNIPKHGIPASFFNSEVPLAWFNLIVKLARTVPGNTGPVQTRSFGYIGLAFYESVVPGMAGYQSLQSQLNGLPALPKVEKFRNYFFSISANAALASMTHHMFDNASPALNYSIDSLENVFNTEFMSAVSAQVFDQFAKADYERSISFGKSISDAIYAWSLTDGGDKGYSKIVDPAYVLPVGDGMYVTQPGQIAQHPHWGNNRTFIKDNATSTQPGLPPAYSLDPGSQFYKEELEVYNESINQDPEHKTIALYWAALPPPLVSLSIMNSVIGDRDENLANCAVAYCKLGMALADAFVSCYKTKYTYTQERPITFIQANFNSTWLPLIGTPPFPDYTSAHSVQTGAAAAVLADIFGDNTTFTDYSINDLGFVPRTFTKFSDYANEVGLSRIYGGIHIRSSDFVGLAQGDKVGKHVAALHFKK